MMNDFLKRLLLAAAYGVGAMCLIHFLMATDPGYRGHWLFVFTGQILWLITLILKLAFFLAIAVVVFYLLVIAIQIHDSWQEHKADEAMKMNNEEVAKRNAAQQAIAASAREFEAVAEKKRKENEFEVHQRKRHLEKHGPRSEEDALAKAMDSLKFRSFE